MRAFGKQEARENGHVAGKTKQLHDSFFTCMLARRILLSQVLMSFLGVAARPQHPIRTTQTI